MRPVQWIGVLGLLLPAMIALPLDAAWASERREMARNIHDEVIENFPDYVAIRQTKVLVGCINWERSSPSYLDNREWYIYYTDPDSDAGIFIADLLRPAISWCKRDRKRFEWDCDCVSFDKNGKTAFKVPKSFIQD